MKEIKNPIGVGTTLHHEVGVLSNYPPVVVVHQYAYSANKNSVFFSNRHRPSVQEYRYTFEPGLTPEEKEEIAKNLLALIQMNQGEE